MKPWASRFCAAGAIIEEDSGNTRNVAVVNEAFAKKFFHGQDPIGKHFGLDMPEYNKTFEIVGIVRDSKYADPQPPGASDVIRSVGPAR